MKNPQFVNAVVKRHNYNTAMHMLCIKMGWAKEYAWYFLRRDEEKCANGGREAFIKKATRILAYNYEGIHNGDCPSLSPRLLPNSNPLSQPLRFPPEYQQKEV